MSHIPAAQHGAVHSSFGWMGLATTNVWRNTLTSWGLPNWLREW